MLFPRERIVATAAEALSAAGEIGYPLVVKTARPDVLHRTEAAGVVLGVADGEALTRAVRALEARVGPGPLLVQEEVPQGLELLVGGRRDPSFGPTVLVGLGGVLAELLRDVSVGLAPLAPETARAMLARGPAGGAPPGVSRGARPSTRARWPTSSSGSGTSSLDHAAIAELDLNPLIASGGRLVAVDALVLVNPESTEAGRACDAT